MAVDLHRMQIIKACDHDEFCSCSHTYPNGSHSTGQNLLGGQTLQVNTLYSEITPTRLDKTYWAAKPCKLTRFTVNMCT